MQTYKLDTLLAFFRSQQEYDYDVIDLILDVLGDDCIPDEDKKDFVIRTFRKHGLNEVTHKEGRFELPIKKTRSVKPYKPLWEIPHEHWCYQVQMVTVDFLSGTVHFEMPLN